MYKLVPDFNCALFSKFVVSNTIHEVTDRLANTSSVVTLTLTGSRYSAGGNNHVIWHFIPRLSTHYLKNLYASVARQSLQSKETVSHLYRLGLGLPKSEILSTLWHEMPAGGSVQLPDDTTITYKELKDIFKLHLKKTFKESFLYCYQSDIVKYYKSLISYTLPEKTKKTLNDSVVISGSKADIILVYRCFRNVLTLNHAVLLDGDKFADITYQATFNTSIPQTFDNTMSSSIEGKYIAVLGKFCLRKEYKDDLSQEFLDSKVSETVNLDLDTYDLVKKESLESRSSNKRFVNKYKEKYFSALNYVNQIQNKPRSTAKEKARATQAKALVDAVDKCRLAFREERRTARTQNTASPANVLEFVAYDLLLVTGNTAKPFKTGEYHKAVSVDYTTLKAKLRELGFAVMGKTKRTTNAKSMQRILTKGKAFWVESK